VHGARQYRVLRKHQQRDALPFRLGIIKQPLVGASRDFRIVGHFAFAARIHGRRYHLAGECQRIELRLRDRHRASQKKQQSCFHAQCVARLHACLICNSHDCTT